MCQRVMRTTTGNDDGDSADNDTNDSDNANGTDNTDGTDTTDTEGEIDIEDTDNLIEETMLVPQ